MAGLASWTAGLLDWSVEAVRWSFDFVFLSTELGYPFANVAPIRRLRNGEKTGQPAYIND